ncbi:MAG: tryptophan--tRNA ligase [Patescibacteria group bacterium]|nr:tryptophan--tRNA ligase [Patescibacteria group bacterium]MDE2015096.1 tryptophan--tRNA ligase [Patescibacteria group bacterium]MDE2226524.1 tryptophan--tRNA ligase [Patescibacteria group bacterium]
MKPILVSGIQTSGRLHLGNYLGALKNFVDLQNSGKYDCYFFLADLHSLTEAFNPEDKHKQVIELAADFLAAGLDPKKSVIFQQSQVPAHTELGWIFNTITPFGELNRMTQFKEKSDAQKENANVGLLTYPTLMAADILLYDAKFVPVGDDQKQHLELTRTIARKFNAKFGETFTEPQPLFTAATRVMNLGEPERKMSKSRSHPQNVIFVDDSPEEISAKIKSAVTDSGSEVKYDIKNKPAISNLLTIYSALSGEAIPKLEKYFTGKKYSEFKVKLAELISDYFADYRKKKKLLLAKPQTLITTLKSGSAKAAKVADKKIHEVKKIIGLAI